MPIDHIGDVRITESPVAGTQEPREAPSKKIRHRLSDQITGGKRTWSVNYPRIKNHQRSSPRSFSSGQQIPERFGSLVFVVKRAPWGIPVLVSGAPIGGPQGDERARVNNSRDLSFPGGLEEVAQSPNVDGLEPVRVAVPHLDMGSGVEHSVASLQPPPQRFQIQHISPGNPNRREGHPDPRRVPGQDDHLLSFLG